MPEGEKTFPIVGIGASAGGIPALEGFFSGLGHSEGEGLAFVIVTHLNPERQSMLTQVVQHFAKLPVVPTADGLAIERDHIYVMPENVILTVADGTFQHRHFDPEHRERKPIDVFLASLAKDRGEFSVGVILSGGDGDGTLGIKAIKAQGGLTLAQVSDGVGPRNPDMPDSAIGSGLVDLALPAEEMGAALVEFARSLSLTEALDATANQSAQDQELEQTRQQICELLLVQTGHDFAGYKSKTFLRRVQRRMQIVQVGDMAAYISRLRSDTSEVMHLFRDLLINVTSFFRDEGAFAALEKLVIPHLFEGKGAGDTIRIWVPGCATGEEVYSIAILLRERMATLSVCPRVQIFATDIDDTALEVARAGRYPVSMLDGVSAERRDRFFVADGMTYVVAKEVRELCVFSPHSVIRDPPFSRMDLVSCRNLLIYFGPEVQEQVIPTFHYALRPGGYLFLGTSESTSQHGQLFAPLDKKHRIFQSRGSRRHRLPMPASLVGGSRKGSGTKPVSTSSLALQQAVEAHVLEQFAPPHVVINAEGDMVYFSSRTGRFLEAPPGSPSRQLLASARKGLKIELRACIREAMETGRPARREHVAMDDEEDLIQYVGLTVEPLPDRGHEEQLFLVLFSPEGRPERRGRGDLLKQHDRESVLSELEDELLETRERLQGSIEEYETALEELKSSNEELVSVNEEAQSTNEELEASKEEMQSLNEELQTINAELTSKVEELDRANGDLRNLFESTRIATIFLDKHLVIRNFTPAASAFFRLRRADIGRPLTDLASYLAYPELRDDIRDVFETGELVEHRSLIADSEDHYLVRLVPYRGSDGKTEGVVVTFLDVTSMVRAEEHQRLLTAELGHRIKNLLAIVTSLVQHGAKNAVDVGAFAESLIGRITAMGRAIDGLVGDDWEVLEVGDLVTRELSMFGEGRAIAEGPQCQLPAELGLSLSLVIHELATNAAKYGALSSDAGQVRVEWRVEDRRFRLDWVETGGPRVEPLETRGFGMELIQAEVEQHHRGKLITAFRPEGLELSMEIPL